MSDDVILRAREASVRTGHPDRYGSEECADAAVRVVLEHLLSGTAHYTEDDISALYVEHLYEQVAGQPYQKPRP